MLPEEVSKFIGKKYTRTLEVEKGAIRKFADAVDDRNPLYWDEEYARKRGYRSIISPPGFFGWPLRWVTPGPLYTEELDELKNALDKIGYTRGLDGGMDYELYKPVQGGDTLSAVSHIKDVLERKGSTGKLAFSIIETTFTNQLGEVVAKSTATHIHR